MKKKMLNKFWYWMNERHSIYLKRKAGEPYPWTKDKILQEYKFTNTFRQLDRVTQELTKRKNKLPKKDMINLFFHIVTFRMFNWPPTYDVLNEAGLLDKWNEKKAIKILRKFKSEDNKVFTGAYVITNSGRKEDKITVVCEAVTALWKDREFITDALQGYANLEEANRFLLQYPCVGKFIAYELITDLRHTKMLDKSKDIMTWANPGPGAKRGLNRLYGRELKFTQPDVKFIEEMRTLLSHCNLEMIDEVEMGKKGKLTVLVKDKRRLEMRDVEHVTCEFDKFMRVKNNEGRPRSKFSYTNKR